MKKHNGKVIDKVRKHKVINCISCGFTHIDPVPSKEAIAQLYKSNYYSNERPLYIKRNLEDERWWQTVFKDRLETITAFKRSKGERMAEFGSGPGLFLKYVNKLGWEVLGIEPSPIAAKFSRKNGVKVVESLFEDLDINNMSLFDTVCMFEVLEHLSAPGDILIKTNKMLKVGGIICISVPNDYNPLQKIVRKAFKLKPYWLAPPLHINYFTIESISKLLKKSGFDVVYEETNFPMEFFLLFGDNYIGNDKLGRFMHGKRKKLDIALSNYDNRLKRDLYKCFSDLNIGRNITIYGRKK